MAIACNNDFPLDCSCSSSGIATWHKEMIVLSDGVYLDGRYVGKLIGFQNDLAVIQRVSTNRYLNGKFVLLGCDLDQMEDLKSQYPDLPNKREWL